jgi:serine/threonine protein kinase
LFFVMDFIDGTDLREVLSNTGAIEPSRAVELLEQLAAALDAAHRRGLVHRDVKPANVLITVQDGEEHAYLTDFGVAKRYDSIAELTAHGAVLGTVDYMSPEQITGSRIDARTDVYALACVFFQMLTAKVPYERENSVATLFAHVHDPPPVPDGELAELYPTFATVIAKALAKEPGDRYLSAGDFARDAAAALHGSHYVGPGTSVATGDATVANVDDVTALSDAQPPEARSPSGASLDGENTPLWSHAQPTPAAPPSLTASAPSSTSAEPEPDTTPTRTPGTTARRTPPRARWVALAVVPLLAAAVIAIIALSSAVAGVGRALCHGCDHPRAGRGPAE